MAWTDQGLRHRESGDLRRAQLAFERALEIDPGYARAQRSLDELKAAMEPAVQAIRAAQTRQAEAPGQLWRLRLRDPQAGWVVMAHVPPDRYDLVAVEAASIERTVAVGSSSWSRSAFGPWSANPFGPAPFRSPLPAGLDAGGRWAGARLLGEVNHRGAPAREYEYFLEGYGQPERVRLIVDLQSGLPMAYSTVPISSEDAVVLEDEALTWEARYVPRLTIADPTRAEAATPPALGDSAALALVGRVAEVSAVAKELALGGLAARRPDQPTTDYYVEVSWSDKDRPRKGMAVVAPVADLPEWFECRAAVAPWCVASFEPDMGFDEVRARLLAQRRQLNESRAIGDLRVVFIAQTAFAATYAGSYAPNLDALARPESAGLEGLTPFLPPGLTVPERGAYRFTLHPGTTGFDGGPWVLAFAYTAVPVSPGQQASRAFCVDHSGTVCAGEAGTLPEIDSGECPPPPACRPLQ